MRYIPIAGMIKKDAPGSILEVGSGPGGISLYLCDREVTGVDLDFSGLEGMAGANFKPVKADARALPFADGSFDVVVCSDMLEHVPAPERKGVIKELWRVARRKVYLGFPIKETYGPWETKIERMYKALRKEVPDWMRSHIKEGLPSEKEMSSVFQGNNMPFKVIPNENNVVHLCVMFAAAAIPATGAVVRSVSPDRWIFREHPFGENAARTIFYFLRALPHISNFGGTVRKIFVLEKEKSRETDIAVYYDTNPESISSPFGGIGTWDAEHAYLDEVLEKMGVDISGKKVLDVGCGSGWFASYCIRKKAVYTGIDISDVCVRYTLKVTPNVMKASGEELPFDKGSFDYVFYIDSFEHFPRQGLAAAEAFRVLGSDGKVFISLPNYSNICGLVKKFQEGMGFAEKDTWAPFNHWAPQALEHFMTPRRVKKIFLKSGFTGFRMMGGRADFIDGIFPWIDHRYMIGASIIRKAFSLVEKPLNRFFPWLSLHNFWVIGK